MTPPMPQPPKRPQPQPGWPRRPGPHRFTDWAAI